MNRKFNIGDKIKLSSKASYLYTHTSQKGEVVSQHPSCDGDKYTIMFSNYPYKQGSPHYNFCEDDLELDLIEMSPLGEALR